MSLSAHAWQPPEGAVRNAELDAWEVSERDASGARDGDCTIYRDDGSVLLRCRYEAGKRNGAFASYHPNGELESKGSYVDGALDGAFFRYTSSAPGSTPLRSCCVPPGARALRITYGHGAFLGETFYDADGRALRSDGSLMPKPAEGVPSDATYEEGEERWVLRLALDGDRMLRKSFDGEGRLVEEAEIAEGRRVALRQYGISGELCREIHFDRDGVPHGPCVFRYDADDAPYAERAIREVRGAYERGQSTGAWRFFDASGNELCARERGGALSDERLRELFAHETSPASGDALFERATELFEARRVREALFTAARASARAGRTDELVALLARGIVPLQPDVARARAEALDREASPALRGAFEALLEGAEPAAIFRLLATLVPSESAAARELVEAALLLAPGSSRALVTRALVRIEQGDDQGALVDARALGDEFSAVARELEELARVLYPKLAFASVVEEPPVPSEELIPVAPAQPLEAVRRAVGLYATRLQRVREELRSRLGTEPAWLPPDVSFLLEAGPVELRRYTATITDEDEDGTETSEVEVDEALVLASASAANLMTIARADFDALAWLCWAAGLDEVALPTSITPRESFAAAVNEAMLRCFRAHDQLRTAGLFSRSHGVRSFVWEGLPVETLSSRFAEIAAHQYLERRAMFVWLLFPQNQSPFQSDLRKV